MNPTSTHLLGLMVLMPLVGSALSFFVGKSLHHLAGWIATAAAVASFWFAIAAFQALPPGGTLEQLVFNWMAVGKLGVDFTLRFDQLTAVMSLVVTGIGSLIHLYSIAYMHDDESVHRFFSYLNLFLFSMLLLILGGNFVVMFVGWEGVGLCSYLLIGFWFKNLNYAAAGRKAFVVNRIGDAGFLLGMFLLFINLGSLDFSVLRSAIGALPVSPETTALMSAVALCLFVGATGKSAQIPLFVWLPDAMAGPTPVSALIHAATMVTAGVYMMARGNFIFDLAPYPMLVVSWIAVATAFVAATIALTQNDIKKVLAYSTVSQLGFMFMAAGAGAYWVALFHVVTHAFFKACLFLGAGSVIHGCHHEQDMRQMGGLYSKMPITFITYAVATIAIAGIFPFAGYQSKHAILAAMGANTNPFILSSIEMMVLLANITAFLTAFYMTRSVALTFFGSYRGHAHPHESPILMTIPLMVLGFLSLVGGWYLQDRLPQFLVPVLGAVEAHAHETVGQALAHSWIGFSGVGLALFLYLVLPGVPGVVYALSGVVGRLFSGKYFIDELYGALIVGPLEQIARVLWRGVDQGVIDRTVNGAAELVAVNGEIIRHIQTGQVRHYALWMFVGSVLLIAFYFVL